MIEMVLALLLSQGAPHSDEWREPNLPELMAKLQTNTESGYPNLTLQTDFAIIGAPAVEPLIQFLRTPGHAGKRTACGALGEIGDHRATAPLVVMLSDTDSGVRSAAAWALGIIGDRRAVMPLTKALDDPDFQVEWAAVDALGSIGGRRASDALMLAVERRSLLSNFAARALGALRERRAIPLLVSVLGVGRLRGWASEGIGLSDLGDNAVQALCRIGRACTPEVIKALDSDDELVRTRAFAVLTSIRDPLTSDRLYETFLNDRTPGARESAAATLAALKDRRVVPQLLSWLEDPNPNGPAWTAVRCLGSLGERSAVEPLTRLALSSNTRVRQEAIAALGGIRSASSYSALVHLTTAYPREIRSAALSALGAQQDPRAFGVLVNVMKTSDFSSDRFDAETALGVYGDAHAIPALLERARIAPDDQLNCLNAVARCGDAGFQALCDLLRHARGDVRLYAELAIRLYGKRAIEPLQELANDSDRTMAYAAKRELVRLRRAK